MSENKQIMSIREQIKNQAKALQESMASKVVTISKKGTFQVANVDSGSDTIQVVILGFSFNKAYWSTGFSQGSTSLPECQAQGEFSTLYAENAQPPIVDSFFDLTPSAPEDKQPQAEVCGECPFNEYETAAQGKGKACKDSVTLAVLPADDPNGAIHTLRISASGIKHFRAYLKTLATVGTSWYAIKTTLQAVDAGAQYTTKAINDTKSLVPLTDDELLAFYAKVEEAKKLLAPRVKTAEAA
jgi:hypothetical protein